MAEQQLLDRAAALLQLRRPEQAEQLLAEVVDADPDNARALRLLSWAHRTRRRHDLLPGAAERAVAAAPEDALGWEELARAYAACGRRAEAVEVAGRAHELAPDDPDTMVLLAALLLDIDDHRALELTEAALALDPGSSEALRVRSGALGHVGREAESDAALAAALREAPTDELAHRDLASRLFGAGQRDDAEDVLRRGLAADPQSTVLRADLQWEQRSHRRTHRVVVRLVVTVVVVLLCVLCLLLGGPPRLRAALLVPVLVLDLVFWFGDGLWREARDVLRRYLAAPAGIRRKIRAGAPVGLVIPLLVLLVVPYGTTLLPAASATWTAVGGGLAAAALLVVGRVVGARPRSDRGPDRSDRPPTTD